MNPMIYGEEHQFYRFAESLTNQNLYFASGAICQPGVLRTFINNLLVNAPNILAGNETQLAGHVWLRSDWLQRTFAGFDDASAAGVCPLTIDCTGTDQNGELSWARVIVTEHGICSYNMLHFAISVFECVSESGEKYVAKDKPIEPAAAAAPMN
jgi:hypothetical protein